MKNQFFDKENPANWNNKKIRKWIEKNYSSVNLDKFCPFESGRQIVDLNKDEFIERCMSSNEKVKQREADKLYEKLRTLFYDAKKRQ